MLKTAAKTVLGNSMSGMMKIIPALFDLYALHCESDNIMYRNCSLTVVIDIYREVVSAEGLLQPILLPKIIPALFDLYAFHCESDNIMYIETVH